MIARPYSMLFAAAVAFGAAAAFASTADAAMSEAQVKKYLEQLSGGAKVLKVEPVKVDSQSAYKVKLMNPGGNDNGAFQIYTVIVDADTGVPLSERLTKSAN